MNSDLRIFCRLPKLHHITDVLMDCHGFLSVNEVLILIYQAHIYQDMDMSNTILSYEFYYKTAPQYLCDLIALYSNSRDLSMGPSRHFHRGGANPPPQKKSIKTKTISICITIF